MDKDTRGRIEQATQRARRLLEADLGEQLEGRYDVLLNGDIPIDAGAHLTPAEHLVREKIVAAVMHKRAAGMKPAEAVADYLRDCAFTTLNRFVALKMLEARELVQECVSRGDLSSGFKEFCGLAPGVGLLPDGRGYRLYIESIFDELSQEVKVLFDRRDPGSLIWPRRQALADLLEVLNDPRLAGVWIEDETIGWVYQYYNHIDERKAMREVRAPRNSRELAVRNQFFTPRYVVEFLTDNTLGRIWYEMRRGDTELKDRCRYLVRQPTETFLAEGEHGPGDIPTEELLQEELAHQPAYIAHRPKKDPRDLKVLDPACGSGHFLLYAFDLLLAIYEEAWQDAESPRSAATGETLRDNFPAREDLRNALPSLILRHNLHGIDIDPRCVQIAAVALWMRAQRAFQDMGIGRSARARIMRSNIVLAEPMPGEKEMVASFASSLKPAVNGALFNATVGAMDLAGETGPLLRIEDEIQAAVRKIFGDHGELFRREDEVRWSAAEEILLKALHLYTSQAQRSDSYRRRLFTEDAARGFAFIDLCRQRYDVVLMNPPFGEQTTATKNYIDNTYPLSKGNILANFIERASTLLQRDGRIGAIVSRAVFFLTSFNSFREEFLQKEMDVGVFADLGEGVLDAMVETALAVLAPSTGKTEPSPFVRLLVEEDKQQALLRAVDNLGAATLDPNVFLCNLSQLSRLTGAPFVYWVGAPAIRKLAALKTLEPACGDIRVGLQTGDDFRFLRLWSEVSSHTIGQPIASPQVGSGSTDGGHWFWYSKIDRASPFVASIHLLVNWKTQGREIRAFHESRGDSPSRYVRSEEYYFKPGISYMLRSSRLIPYIVPRGVIPTAGRSQVYPHGGEELVFSLLACNIGSAVARFRGEKFVWPKFQNSMVAQIPVVCVDDIEQSVRLRYTSQVAREAGEWRGQFTPREECIEFISLGSSNEESKTFDRTSLLGRDAELEIARLYGLSEVELSELERDVNESASVAGSMSDDDVETSELTEAGSMAENWLSYCVGVTFGRFDVRKCGLPNSSPDPDPFDPLPTCSPGMLTDDTGLPASPPDDYPVTTAQDGVLVQDSGHHADLIHRVTGVTECLSSSGLLDNVSLLKAYNSEKALRSWFQLQYFSHHIKRYSKSRRKAPIYWQLAPPGGSYSIWLYYHRFTKDTFFKVLNDYVIPKLQHEERKLHSLSSSHGPSPTASQRKEISAQEQFVDELRAFREEVARVAPLWNPDLNDGVIINFAPLWRLVPQHRQWQKEVKECWDKLVSGDYDWAHLAMHLWPERVVPKCRKDRSLAIAHDLEEAFWSQGADGKWKPKPVSDAEVERLVRERTSHAVKAALQDLLHAPTPGGAGTRRKTRKA